MEDLTVNISWEYFLGILATLIGIAWYSNGRFTRLETSMEWVKDILKDLKIDSENKTVGAFARQSPVSLTETGKQALKESGLKKWVDNHDKELFSLCEEKKNSNPYEVQEYIFDHFNTLKFDQEFSDRLKKYAFDKGYSTSIMRRIGAIYFRDICLSKFGMKVEDIDKHNPNID